jgi:hypothetical protein
MDEREYLVKAQEADAIANGALNRREQKRWETIAKEYRRLANAIAAQRRGHALSQHSWGQEPRPEPGSKEH